MSILYCMVARRRDCVVLMEYSCVEGNHAKIARCLLEKIPYDSQPFMSYSLDRHVFQYFVDATLVVLSMSEVEVAKRDLTQIKTFLHNVRSVFRRENGATLASAFPGQYDKLFLPAMLKLIQSFGQPLSSDLEKIKRVQDGVEEVKAVMHDNIAKVLERGEKLENLMDKSDVLNQSAMSFKRSSQSLKHRMWWQNTKTHCILCGVVVAIVVIIAMGVCGVTFSNC